MTALSAPASAETLLRDGFNGPDGIITNHFAFWSDGLAGFRSPTWEMESGCALRRSNTLWSGKPSSSVPNINCSNGAGSAVFRLWTKRDDFRNVRVRMRLRNVGFNDGSRQWPAVRWDGVKLWLRRQGGTGSVGLYTAEVNRREGNVIVQKKCAGRDEYHLLAQTSPGDTPPRFGKWEKVGGSVRNLPGGAVRLTVERRGKTVLEAVDRGRGCRPIRSDGRVGIRGDNAEFFVDGFRVSSL